MLRRQKAYLEFLLPNAEEKSERVVARHERPEHILLYTEVTDGYISAAKIESNYASVTRTTTCRNT